MRFVLATEEEEAEETEEDEETEDDELEEVEELDELLDELVLLEEEAEESEEDVEELTELEEELSLETLELELLELALPQKRTMVSFMVGDSATFLEINCSTIPWQLTASVTPGSDGAACALGRSSMHRSERRMPHAATARARARGRGRQRDIESGKKEIGRMNGRKIDRTGNCLT